MSNPARLGWPYRALVLVWLTATGAAGADLQTIMDDAARRDARAQFNIGVAYTTGADLTPGQRRIAEDSARQWLASHASAQP